MSVALTSEACFKGIPKTSAGEVVSFKGWPKLTWFITDHLPKPPKDWQTPPRHSDDTAAYIEVSREGWGGGCPSWMWLGEKGSKKVGKRRRKMQGAGCDREREKGREGKKEDGRSFE